MDATTKTVEAAVKPVDSDNPAGEFNVILSTDALDRDGERLHTDEWKQPLPARIHFDSDHGMSIEKTVGSGVPFINDDGQLQVRGVYASTPHAQMVRQLVNEGHVTSTSVTFQNRKGQKDSAPQRELLNGAFVAVPANPEAVVLSSKAASAHGFSEGDAVYFNYRSAHDVEGHVTGIEDKGTSVDTTVYEVMPLRKYIHPGEKVPVHRSGAHLRHRTASPDEKAFVDDVVTKDDAFTAGIPASGNNPKIPTSELTQKIHDAAVNLGAMCLNEIDAESTVPANNDKSITETSSKTAGTAQDSTSEAAAAETAEKSAVSAAADEDTAARAKQYLIGKSRALLFNIPTE